MLKEIEWEENFYHWIHEGYIYRTPMGEYDSIVVEVWSSDVTDWTQVQ